MKRSRTAALLVAAALAAPLLSACGQDADPGGSSVGSFAFDVTDRAEVASRADSVVIAEVLAERPATDEGRRVLSVRVAEPLWGDPPSDLTLLTTGEGGPRPGETYALAIGETDEPDTYALFAGPHAVTVVTQSNREEVVAEWRAARRRDG